MNTHKFIRLGVNLTASHLLKVNYGPPIWTKLQALLVRPSEDFKRMVSKDTLGSQKGSSSV